MDNVSNDKHGCFNDETCTYYSPCPPIPLPSDPNLTLPSLVLSSSTAPHWPAFIDSSSGLVLSHSQFRWHIRAAAAGLATFGLQRGHVAFLLSPNSIHSPILMLSTMLAGGIITVANPLSTPSEIAKQVSDANPSLLYSTPSLLPKLEGCEALPVVLLPEPESFAADINPLVSRLQTMAVDPRNFSLELETVFSYIRRSVEHAPKISTLWPARTTTLLKLLTTEPSLLPQVEVGQNDPAALLYSSGTTGPSKGVILTHRNLIYLVSTLFTVEGSVLHPERVYLCMIPIFHVYGLALFACALPFMGCSTVIAPRFSLQEMLQLALDYRVTHLPVVPPIVMALTKMGPKAQSYASSLKQVLCGAAPLSKKLAVAFREHFPKAFIKQGYGLTESTGLATFALTEEELERHDSVGRLAPNMEAKVVDTSSGKFLPPNQQGELWIRGPSIMKGYHHNLKATAEMIDSEGWLHTGDLCYFDEDGYLYIVDRIKELIKYKGFQVAPAELEALLLSHPDIADAAVIPLFDEEAGQVPMAFVVRQPKGVLTEAAVMDFISRQVAPYKKIRKVAFLNMIPRSASGKILKRELMAMAKANSKL